MKIAITRLNKELILREIRMKDTIIHVFVKDIIDDFSNYNFLDCLSLMREENLFFIFDQPLKVCFDSVMCSDVVYTGYDKTIG